MPLLCMTLMYLSQKRAIAVSRSGVVVCLLPGEGLWFWEDIGGSMGGGTEQCQYIDNAYPNISPFCLYDCYTKYNQHY